MANEKKLNTRIVLRNDQLSNWTDTTSKPILKGEVAIAHNTDGTFELRVGKNPDGSATWSEASKLRLSSDQIVGLDQEMSKLSASHYVTDDIDKLSAETYNAGDTAVVSTEIGDGTGKVSYTAYVYDGKLSAWKAMDGNYSADNVYFDEDITLAGDYTSVGNVKLTDNTLAAEGKSVSELMTKIFTKEIAPSATAKPTFTFTATTTLTGEIGTTYNVPAATLKMTGTGTYNYAPTNANCSVEIGDASVSASFMTAAKTNSTAMTNNSTLATDAGPTSVTFLSTGTKYTYTASATWTDGVVPKSNLGNEDATKQIKSGTSSFTSVLTATGYYPTFYVVTTSIIDTPTKFSASTSKDENGNSYTKVVDGSYTKKTFTDPDGWYQIFYLTPSVKCSYNSWSGTDSSSGLPVNVVNTTTATVTLLTGDEVTYKVFAVKNSAKGDAGTATMTFA